MECLGIYWNTLLGQQISQHTAISMSQSALVALEIGKQQTINKIQTSSEIPPLYDLCRSLYILISNLLDHVNKNKSCPLEILKEF